MKTIFKVTAVALSLLVFLSASSIGKTAVAWSNGGYTTDQNNPKYGTHDWIADHAMNLLPSNESGWLTQNKNAFLYGTEAPDNSAALFQGRKGYGDTTHHHNYYSGIICIDSSASQRAGEEYQKALACLQNGSYALAAWFAGAMTHYIDDLACWAHVLNNESSTAHSDFESQVDKVTGSYGASMFAVTFDGTLETISASNAATALGQNTYTDGGATYNAWWMNVNFQSGWTNVNQWSQPFKNRAMESINLAVNTVADVLHTLAVESGTNLPLGGEGIQISPETIAIIFIVIVMAIVVVAMFLKMKR
jgi:hypothetical protein